MAVSVRSGFFSHISYQPQPQTQQTSAQTQSNADNDLAIENTCASSSVFASSCARASTSLTLSDLPTYVDNNIAVRLYNSTQPTSALTQTTTFLTPKNAVRCGLYVEDVLDTTDNCARSVDRTHWHHIKREMIRAFIIIDQSIQQGRTVQEAVSRLLTPPSDAETSFLL
jgi:hypothetical protein